jgi:hypothetical protein
LRRGAPAPPAGDAGAGLWPGHPERCNSRARTGYIRNTPNGVAPIGAFKAAASARPSASRV